MPRQLPIMADVTISEDAGGRTISVAQGDQLTVALPENPTTGYRWRVVSVNGNILSLQEDNTLPNGGGLGGGGTRLFRFTAVASGSTVLIAELVRAWEAQGPRSKFEVSIQVT